MNSLIETTITPVSQVYYVKLKTLTPVHVGGAAENFWQKDIDVRIEQGKIERFNYETALRRNPKLIESLIAKGWDMTQIYPHLKTEEDILQTFELPYSSFELTKNDSIRTFYRNGLGQVILPGSAIKGFIRGILIKKLLPHNQRPDEATLRNILGTINNNLMHYLQVGDAVVPTTRIYGSKILSLRHYGDQLGFGWKHDRSGSIPQFEINKFNHPFECIPPNTELVFRMAFVQKGKHFDKIKALNTKALFLDEQKPMKNFLTMIRNHTQQQADKQVAYIKHFLENSDNLEEKEALEKAYNTLATNSQSGATLFRLGGGVGFHSIIGDWKSNDYTAYTKEGIKQVDKHNRGKAAKTRRLAVWEAGGKTQLAPMGWLYVERTSRTPL